MRSASLGITEQAVKVPELMFRVHFGCVTKSPLHFTDIHRCIPPCSVSVTFASEESQGLGPSPLGFFSSSVPVWTAFPYPLTRVRIPAASDYYAPSDSFKDLGVSFGLPLLYSPLPLSFLEGLPCSRHRTYLWIALRWRVHLRVPSPLWGSPSSS